VIYPGACELASESAWDQELRASELTDALRSTMREEYTDATGEEMKMPLRTSWRR
jgi:hypothetical protein